ncbi:hypothetical protein [Thalassobacillus sp. CUG 92003]|uniref:hypothetical protein n=1 Tax=Thalassobacillus sp. CUG 92003 TaxID=2736641 RepID=UPI0015E63C0E|nr:hypothetical protein [Thalassobacillus sp. CUG 92003]
MDQEHAQEKEEELNAYVILVLVLFTGLFNVSLMYGLFIYAIYLLVRYWKNNDDRKRINILFYYSITLILFILAIKGY